MAWDFCTDPDVQARLDWADRFVAEEIEPVESLLYDVVDVGRPEGSIAELFEQWRQEVKDQQLYAVHLPPEQGGQGFGEVNLALLNEVIGRSYWAPYVFATGPGTPGSGQSDVLAVFGTDQQKQRWLYPLLEGKITMIYSMTEPHGGADPTGFRCQAVRDGDEWVINGDKFFSSGAEQAELILLMAVTDPDASAYQGMSMFVVPTNAPGVRIFGELGGLDDGNDDYRGVGFGHHPYIRYQDVRVPADNLIGDQGKAFEMAQRRLSAGRMHHAMRAVALAKREFEMICERALSRYTQGGLLAEKQMVQEMVADAWLELTQFRLLILQAAWIIERDGYGAARRYVAACKVKAAEIRARDGIQGDAHPRSAGHDQHAADHPRNRLARHRRRADRGPQGDPGPTGAARLPAEPGPVAHPLPTPHPAQGPRPTRRDRRDPPARRSALRTPRTAADEHQRQRRGDRPDDGIHAHDHRRGPLRRFRPGGAPLPPSPALSASDAARSDKGRERAARTLVAVVGASDDSLALSSHSHVPGWANVVHSTRPPTSGSSFAHSNR